MNKYQTKVLVMKLQCIVNLRTTMIQESGHRQKTLKSKESIINIFKHTINLKMYEILKMNNKLNNY